MSKNKTNDRGFAAIMALLIVISLVLVVALSIIVIVVNERQIDKNLVDSTQSYYSAESGVEDAVLRVIKGYDYDAVNSFVLGDATISQNITQVDNSINVQSSSSYLNSNRKLETSLRITSDDISFYYGVQVGEGGLEMNDGTNIYGNLYSNGIITGTLEGGGSTISGDVFVATGMSLDANGIWDTYDNDLIFGENKEPADIAMSFTPTSTGTLSQVSFYVKNSSPTHKDGTIRIVEDNAGSPSTTVLATTIFSTSKIGSSYGWVSFGFSAPANLTSGSTYWIIIDLDLENKKYFYIGKAPGNVNSVSKYSSDWSKGEWTIDIEDDVEKDYEYKAWIGGLSSSLNSMIIKGNAHANAINDSKICGDAYYHTIDADSSNFLNSPSSPPCSAPLTLGTAYPDSPDPAVEAMPISDSNIDDWEAAALAGGVYSDAEHCQPKTEIILGPIKLVCDFTPGPGAKIILNGTVWVEGNLNLSNNNIVELASGYGTNSGIIIADKIGGETTDGIIIVKNNTNICGSAGYNTETKLCNASNGSYVLLLSTHSGTSTDAIEVHNNADGAIFYAHNGSVVILNNANLREVTAYKLELLNNTSVTYESGLANTSFSSGPGGGWAIDDWNETQ